MTVPRRCSGIVLLLLATTGFAWGGEVPREREAATEAGRDSLWWRAPLHHAWIEAGVGWMSAPTAIRRQFEAGQGFGAGVEAQPRRHLRLRLGGDYQIMPALGTLLVVEEYGDVFGTVLDTIRYEMRSPAWMGALRAEAAVRVPGGLWLTGGGGGGYFNDGLGPSVRYYADGTQLRFRGADRDGWGWFATTGVSVGLEPILHVPVGLGVQWRTAWRSRDAMRFWTIRCGTQRP